MCDPARRILLDQYRLCADWRHHVLGLHQAGGLEIAGSAAEGMEAELMGLPSVSVDGRYRVIDLMWHNATCKALHRQMAWSRECAISYR